MIKALPVIAKAILAIDPMIRLGDSNEAAAEMNPADLLIKSARAATTTDNTPDITSGIRVIRRIRLGEIKDRAPDIAVTIAVRFGGPLPKNILTKAILNP